MGKLGVLRVHQGTVRPGSQLFVGDARKPVKIGHLFTLLGKDTKEITAAGPGDICAIPKVDELHLDAVLHDSHDEDQFHLLPVAFPPPMLGLAIEPERRGDEQRLADTLHKLTAEDPCVRVEHHAAVNETVLYGMGEFHLRVLLERMSERYGVHVKTHPPSIPYRGETITRPAEGQSPENAKQTPAAPDKLGKCTCASRRSMTAARASEFVDDVTGGAIPGQYIPAVEKGVRQVLTEGALAGFPIQDVRVIVYDGKHHSGGLQGVSRSFPRVARRSSTRCRKRPRSCSSRSCCFRSPRFATSIGDITGDLATKARAHQRQQLPAPQRATPGARAAGGSLPSTSRASRRSPAGRALTPWN